MKTYIAFLRGVNVGGKSMIKMADLASALTDAGFAEVRTYIQSGNVLFASTGTDEAKLARDVERTIEHHFKLDVAVVVYGAERWRMVVKQAPSWWGKGEGWKHNAFIVIPPTTAAEVAELMGDIKPEFEKIKVGDGMLYQSSNIAANGRITTGSKLVANPVYKRLTIRNLNTARKLAELVKGE